MILGLEWAASGCTVAGIALGLAGCALLDHAGRKWKARR